MNWTSEKKSLVTNAFYKMFYNNVAPVTFGRHRDSFKLTSYSFKEDPKSLYPSKCLKLLLSTIKTLTSIPMINQNHFFVWRKEN